MRLVIRSQVVVPNVWRIADEQVSGDRLSICADEVGNLQIEIGARPQMYCRRSIVSVDFDSSRNSYAIAA